MGLPHPSGERLSLLFMYFEYKKIVELNSEHFCQSLFAYMNHITKKVMVKKVNFSQSDHTTSTKIEISREPIMFNILFIADSRSPESPLQNSVWICLISPNTRCSEAYKICIKCDTYV